MEEKTTGSDDSFPLSSHGHAQSQPKSSRYTTLALIFKSPKDLTSSPTTWALDQSQSGVGSDFAIRCWSHMCKVFKDVRGEARQYVPDTSQMSSMHLEFIVAFSTRNTVVAPVPYKTQVMLSCSSSSTRYEGPVRCLDPGHGNERFLCHFSHVFLDETWFGDRTV